MVTLSKIKLICDQYQIKPRSERGQNFLIDQNVVKKIIQAADLKKADMVLEIGPGLGILTGALAQRTGQVMAVEIDHKIFSFLKTEFAGRKNLKLILGDALKINFKELALKNFNYQLVANLPYSVATPLIRGFLTQEPKPRSMVVMLQQEVGERLVARPGEMNLLALATQFFGSPEILFKVSRHCFWPEPKVDSLVVRIKLKNLLPDVNQKKFFQLARIGFSAKRKQLQNNLAAGLKLKNERIKIILRELGLNEKIRAQDLSLDDWIKLTKKL